MGLPRESPWGRFLAESWLKGEIIWSPLTPPGSDVGEELWTEDTREHRVTVSQQRTR